MTNIIENNKLIAQFMGAKFKNHSSYETYSFDDFKTQTFISVLQYDKKWDWLMPVVSKCDVIRKEMELKYHGVDSDLDDPKGWRAWNYRSINLSTDISRVFKSTVKFINWYNQQK